MSSSYDFLDKTFDEFPDVIVTYELLRALGVDDALSKYYIRIIEGRAWATKYGYDTFVP